MSKYIPPNRRATGASHEGALKMPSEPTVAAPISTSLNFESAVKNSGTRAARVPNSALKVVEVDSLVLLKVLKHCRDFYPTPVNGQLLGADNKDVLEVTNCFPLPQKKEILAQIQHDKSVQDLDERVDEEFDKYQDKMASLMHDVNVDCFTVGWYQTLSFNDLKSKDTIDSLAVYQELVEKAVMLGFDPVLHAVGKMAFRAFRVNPEFLPKYHECEQDVSKYNKLRAKDILIEVPIVINNPFLVDAFLEDYSTNDPRHAIQDYDILDLDQNAYIESHVNFLSSCLEDISEEQDKLQRYQRESLKQQQLQKQFIERRRLENEQRRLRGEPVLPNELDSSALRKIDPPSQLPTLLMANQAAAQSSEITRVCADTIAKASLLYWGVCKKKLTSHASPDA